MIVQAYDATLVSFSRDIADPLRSDFVGEPDLAVGVCRCHVVRQVGADIRRRGHRA